MRKWKRRQNTLFHSLRAAAASIHLFHRATRTKVGLPFLLARSLKLLKEEFLSRNGKFLIFSSKWGLGCGAVRFGCWWKKKDLEQEKESSGGKIKGNYFFLCFGFHQRVVEWKLAEESKSFPSLYSASSFQIGRRDGMHGIVFGFFGFHGHATCWLVVVDFSKDTVLKLIARVDFLG